MKRREFIKSSIALGTSTLAASTLITDSNAKSSSLMNPIKKNNFHLRYAPHFGMFKNIAGDNEIDQLKFAADIGFTAWEDNGMTAKSVELQEKIANTMQKLGMLMGVFVAHNIYWSEPNLASGDKTKREEFLKDIKNSVEVAKRVNAKWMTVVPGHVDLRLEMGYQTANVIESLKAACEILEPHNLVIVLEPLNFYNHPGLFLTKMAQAYHICRAVNSASCKILCDIYHQQVTEGNLIPNIDSSWDEIAYFQIGDNPGRNEPGTGEINYQNVFKHIHEKGYTGVMGMEHGNSQKGKDGEQLVFEAYKKADNF